MGESIFAILNTWHMGILCLIMTMIHICKARMYGGTKAHRRSENLRWANWLLFSIVWFYVSLVELPVDTLRALLRFAFAVLVVSEIGYNYWVIRIMINRCLIRVPGFRHRKRSE